MPIRFAVHEIFVCRGFFFFLLLFFSSVLFLRFRRRPKSNIFPSAPKRYPPPLSLHPLRRTRAAPPMTPNTATTFPDRIRTLANRTWSTRASPTHKRVSRDRHSSPDRPSRIFAVWTETRERSTADKWSNRRGRPGARRPNGKPTKKAGSIRSNPRDSVTANAFGIAHESGWLGGGSGSEGARVGRLTKTI